MKVIGRQMILSDSRIQKRIRAAACASLCLLLCACSAFSPAVHAQRGGYEEAPAPERWYRERLDDRQKRVYDAFEKAAETPFGDEIAVASKGEEGGRFTLREVNEIYQVFWYDHPELIWLGSSFRYSGGGDQDEPGIEAVGLIPIFASKEELEKKEEAFARGAETFLEGIDPEAPDSEKARRIYDRMVAGISYDPQSVYDPSLAEAHSAYGALVNKEAACDGYALAYRYLLSRLDIPCLCIPGEGDGEPHVWNTVYWDGRWHEVDVTWDAMNAAGGQPGPTDGRYYDLTTEEMNADHEREASPAALLAPEAP